MLPVAALECGCKALGIGTASAAAATVTEPPPGRLRRLSLLGALLPPPAAAAAGSSCGAAKLAPAALSPPPPVQKLPPPPLLLPAVREPPKACCTPWESPKLPPEACGGIPSGLPRPPSKLLPPVNPPAPPLAPAAASGMLRALYALPGDVAAVPPQPRCCCGSCCVEDSCSAVCIGVGLPAALAASDAMPFAAAAAGAWGWLLLAAAVASAAGVWLIASSSPFIAGTNTCTAAQGTTACSILAR